MYNKEEEEKMIDYLCNILCYIVELLTVNCKKIYYVRRKQEGHKMDWGHTLYYHFFCIRKILHYQPIRIIEKQRNCQMWNSDVPPKPYRPP